MYKSLLSPQALKQRDEIIKWYAERSLLATENFIKELDKTIDKICVAPFGYRNPYKHFRVIKMKIYPYYVIYSIKEKDEIIVVAKLYHTSRDPKKKYRNLK